MLVDNLLEHLCEETNCKDNAFLNLLYNLIKETYGLDKRELEKDEDEIKAYIWKAAKRKGLILTAAKSSKYNNPDGTFKKMSCPDNPDDESKFCGCVRYMMSKEGGNHSLESAKKICAKIAQNKGA